jgi:hypothetical protein
VLNLALKHKSDSDSFLASVAPLLRAFGPPISLGGGGHTQLNNGADDAGSSAVAPPAGVEEEEDGAPAARDRPRARHIFFLEFTERNATRPLNWVYACAVLRACRFNPTWTVYLLTTRQGSLAALRAQLRMTVTNQNGSTAASTGAPSFSPLDRNEAARASSYSARPSSSMAMPPNLRIERADFASLFKGTPLAARLTDSAAALWKARRGCGRRGGNPLKADLSDAAR